MQPTLSDRGEPRPPRVTLLQSPAMSQPPTAPIYPADLPGIARDTMKAAKFPFLGTVDGDQPRLRPVSPVRTDGFTVYVASLRRYGKTAEIDGMDLVMLRGEKLSRNEVYFDRMALFGSE